MSYLAGIVLDVSSSMKAIFQGGTGGNFIPLSSSIDLFISNIIGQDVSTNVDVFAIGVGASKEPVVFDILKSIDVWQDAISHGKQEPSRFEKPSKRSIYSGKKALECINKWLPLFVFEEMKLGDRSSLSKLLYGTKPLTAAVREAAKLFAGSRAEKKLLFIVSDGESTDAHDLNPSCELKNMKVTLVCLYVSTTPGIAPMELYDIVDERWSGGAKYLFEMSSTVVTQPLARVMLIKNEWTIRSEETRLFLQVNNKEHFQAAINCVRIVFCFQDSLMELLKWISYDIDINQFRPNFQKGGTCYANAAAAVIYFAMKRILGRKDCKEFKELLHDIIQRYGEHGAPPLEVLEAVCPQYRLECKKIDVAQAMEAITAKRPVLATFFLTKREWVLFTDFFSKKENGNGILTKANLDISLRSSEEKLEGHAVVLISFDSRCFRLMNSWGERWAESGFFRVQNADVLNMEFIDVYWKEEILTQEEKNFYISNRANVEQRYKKILERIQKTEYPCPKCTKMSSVTEYTCENSFAWCPRCSKKFPIPKGSDAEPFMNMYLIWLAK